MQRGCTGRLLLLQMLLLHPLANVQLLPLLMQIALPLLLLWILLLLLLLCRCPSRCDMVQLIIESA
jgi:hypothetical protein